MKVTVGLPTYRRPEPLIRCLRALELQLKAPFEVLVVVRETDVETRDRLCAMSFSIKIRIVTITSSGLVAALNSALGEARGDIMALTDDDAEPRPDWLSQIDARFAQDPRVGAVGGRDIIHKSGLPIRGMKTVGKVQWFGRVVGNHHAGVGPAREVEVLKGVNMSLRLNAVGGLQFDERLRGTGAQVHNDMAMSLALRRRGWLLIYDPAIIVDHYPAERFGGDVRGRFDAGALASAAHNETLILLEYLPAPRRAAYLLWAFLIGTRTVPGVLQLFRVALGKGQHPLQRYRASLVGRFEGYRTWRSANPRRTIVPLAETTVGRR
jgi:GT2 family glycosyltransferase